MENTLYLSRHIKHEAFCIKNFISYIKDRAMIFLRDLNIEHTSIHSSNV